MGCVTRFPLHIEATPIVLVPVRTIEIPRKEMPDFIYTDDFEDPGDNLPYGEWLKAQVGLVDSHDRPPPTPISLNGLGELYPLMDVGSRPQSIFASGH